MKPHKISAHLDNFYSPQKISVVSNSLIIDLFLAQGIIEDPMTKIEWHSCQNLTSEELVIIANTAKKVKNIVEILQQYCEKVVGD